MLAGTPTTPDDLRTRIRDVRTRTDRPFGVNLIVVTGFAGPFTTDDHIAVCVEESFGLVTLSWELPPATSVERLHGAGARVWMQIGSPEEARAAAALHVEGVVAQGSEAGGHARAALPLASLPAVLEAVPGTLVLAAGGIADGAAAAAALAAGADGVWVGTRLAASEESNAHREYKRRIVEGDPESTVRTTLFGPEWPGATIRVLRNRVVDAWAGREQDAVPAGGPIGRTVLMAQPYEMPPFSAILPTLETEGDLEEMCLGAESRSAAVVTSVLPAGDIVRSMMSEAVRLLAGRGGGQGAARARVEA